MPSELGFDLALRETDPTRDTFERDKSRGADLVTRTGRPWNRHCSRNRVPTRNRNATGTGNTSFHVSYLWGRRGSHWTIHLQHRYSQYVTAERLLLHSLLVRTLEIGPNLSTASQTAPSHTTGIVKIVIQLSACV